MIRKIFPENCIIQISSFLYHNNCENETEFSKKEYSKFEVITQQMIITKFTQNKHASHVIFTIKQK